MSPSSRSAKLVDARTDIWALGLILAECITGKTVYQGTSKFAILASIAAESRAEPASRSAGARPISKGDPSLSREDSGQALPNGPDLALDLVPFAVRNRSRRRAETERIGASAEGGQRSGSAAR